MRMEKDEIVFRKRIPENPSFISFSDEESRLLAKHAIICFGKPEREKRKRESGSDTSMKLLAAAAGHVSSSGTSKEVADEATYLSCFLGNEEYYLRFCKTSLEKYKNGEENELRLTRSSYTELKRRAGTPKIEENQSFELVLEATAAQLSMLECDARFDIIAKSACVSKTRSKTSKPLLMLPSPAEAAQASPLPEMSSAMMWSGYEAVTGLRKILMTFISLLIGDESKVETLTSGWLGVNFVKDNDPTSLGLKAFIEGVQRNYNTEARGDGEDALLEMKRFLNCEICFLTFFRSVVDFKSLEFIDTCFRETPNASPSILCVMLSDLKIFLEKLA